MRFIVPALAALLVLPAFAGAGGSAPAATIQGFAFAPGVVTLDAGRSVTWTNADPVAHTVTADDGSWSSDVVAPGGTFTHAFLTPGVYAYHCAIHLGMHGQVVVRDPTLPDLVVASLAARPQALAPGVADPTTTSVSFTVQDAGGGAAPATVLRLSFTDAAGDHALGDAQVPALAPGASYAGTMDWRTAGDAGDVTLHALADATGAANEGPAEGNNAASLVVTFGPVSPGTGVAPLDDAGA